MTETNVISYDELSEDERYRVGYAFDRSFRFDAKDATYKGRPISEDVVYRCFDDFLKDEKRRAEFNRKLFGVGESSSRWSKVSIVDRVRNFFSPKPSAF